MDDRQGLFAAAHVDPNAHYYEQLEKIYDQRDERTTVHAAGTQPIFTAEKLEPVVPTAEQAEATSVLIKDFGGGRQLVTHTLRVHDFAAGFPRARRSGLQGEPDTPGPVFSPSIRCPRLRSARGCIGQRGAFPARLPSGTSWRRSARTTVPEPTFHRRASFRVLAVAGNAAWPSAMRSTVRTDSRQAAYTTHQTVRRRRPSAKSCRRRPSAFRNTRHLLS